MAIKDEVVFTLRMPRALRSALAEIAEREYTSTNTQMLKALEAWVREHKAEDRAEQVAPAGRR